MCVWTTQTIQVFLHMYDITCHKYYSRYTSMPCFLLTYDSWMLVLLEIELLSFVGGLIELMMSRWKFQISFVSAQVGVQSPENVFLSVSYLIG